jgi:hypothetical protein
MRKRSWFLSISILLIIVAAASGGWFVQSTETAWQAMQRDVEAMKAESQATMQDVFDDPFVRYADLEVSLRKPFLDRLFKTFEGFERFSRRGNRFVINQAELHMGEGFLEIEADGLFESRLGLYSGPVHARYLVFTRVLETGRFHFEFQLAEAVPKREVWAQGFVSRWLTLKINSRMRIPEWTLPLGFERAFIVPERIERVRNDELEIRIPKKEVAIRLEDPKIRVKQNSLDLTVGLVQIGDHPPRGNVLLPPPLPLESAHVAVALNFGIFDDLIQDVVAAPEDAYFKASHMPKVWEQQKRVIGIKVRNWADIHDLEGVLDVKVAKLEPRGAGFELHLEAEGFFQGRVEGRAYGFDLARPFQAFPTVKEKLDVFVRYQADGIVLDWEQKPLALQLEVETELMGRSVTFNHAITVDSQKILKPLKLKSLISRSVEVPVSTRGRKALAKREVSLEANWQACAPTPSMPTLQVWGILAPED